LRDEFGSFALLTMLLAFVPPNTGSVTLVDCRIEDYSFCSLCLEYFSMKRVSFSSKSLISWRKLFLWWKMLS